MTSAHFDPDGALEFFDGDTELRDQVLATLLQVLDNTTQTFPGMVARQEWNRVCDVVHRLGPSLRIFSPSAAEYVSALGSWRRGDSTACEKHAHQLIPLLEGLRRDVADFLHANRE